MRLTITVEEFQLNEVLKLIQSTIRWKLRVGYRKGDLLPLLVAEYEGGHIVRNININSTLVNIQELSDLLAGKYDKFHTLADEKIIFLDEILKDAQDFRDVQSMLQVRSDTEVELKYIVETGVDALG